MRTFKIGDRIVITGTRPAKFLRGRRGVVEGLLLVDYVRLRLDGEKGITGFRDFPEDQLTLESVVESPLWKALE